MKLSFVGCRYNTIECMQQLLDDGFDIDHLLTISAATARKNAVYGFEDLRPFCEAHGIPVTVAKTYSLKEEMDAEKVLALRLDILLVIGWQRLIPPWLLDALRVGAFGMHGSPDPLPKGRGRSPMNWSLIMGRDSFATSLFRYDAGIDSGGIIGTQVFDINPWDDIASLHLKNRISMNQLLRRHLPDLLAGDAREQPQPRSPATYYPKRTPEDGIVDWNKTSHQLHDFCRGTTRPYPGAFSFLGEHLIRLWQLVPFDMRLDFEGAVVGELVATGYGNELVVRTVDGSVLIRDYETEDGYVPRRGDRFHTPSELQERVLRWQKTQIPGPAPS